MSDQFPYKISGFIGVGFNTPIPPKKYRYLKFEISREF
jgi:hypothetical protein